MNIQLPINDPLITYGIILVIILFLPMLLSKIRIPSIVGLILMGMLIGPNGLNIISSDSNIEFFGNIGLIFIMFIAGLDLDFHEFKKFRNFNIVYGILLFLLPSLIAFLVFANFFGKAPIDAMLIAIIFSTNTLISYPIVKRLNIHNTMPVIAAVGAAVLADTSILICLGFLKQFAIDGFNLAIVLKVVLKFILLAVVTLIIFPRLTKKFFNSYDVENTSQFLFTFTLLILSAILSHSLDIEPIVGAFLMGLALNNLIPHNSFLMQRIEFVGNALFIPFFLIYVGFLIDLKVIFSNIEPWVYAILFIAITFIGKYLAILLAGKQFKIDKDSRRLIFGLNLSQAGATIAIAIVVHSLNILDTNALNAIILLILLTCIVSSFISEETGKVIAAKTADINEIPEVMPQRILVPYANPKTVDSLIKTAILFKEKNSEPIFPISVIREEKDYNSIIYNNNQMMSGLLKQIEAYNVSLSPTTRLDASLPHALDKAINELLITCTILGWNFKRTIDSSLYNKQLIKLLSRNPSMILVAKLNKMQNIKQINLYVPQNAQFEKGFLKWNELIKTFAKNIKAVVNIYHSESKSQYISNLYKSYGIKNNIVCVDEFYKIDIDTVATAESVNIMVHSRMKGISYFAHNNLFISNLVDRAEDTNLILLYPEQSKEFSPGEILDNDDFDESLISSNLNLIERIRNKIFR